MITDFLDTIHHHVFIVRDIFPPFSGKKVTQMGPVDEDIPYI
jgi:hypothetical protein